MSISFSKDIPNEPYIDDYSEGKKLDLVYSGPDIVRVLVSKENGFITGINLDEDSKYNQERDLLVEVVAKDNPAAAYFFTYVCPSDYNHEFIDEVLPDGSVYQQITNATIKEYFWLSYDLDSNTWVWNKVLREKKSILNETADKYRKYVKDNLESVKTNKSVKLAAENYLATLDKFEETGIGSIPSWKKIEFDIKTVPIPPVEFISAVGVLP